MKSSTAYCIMGSVSVVLADDQLTVLEQMQKLLEAQNGIRVVGRAHNGAQALALTKELRPDVLLLDIAMPVMSGIEALPLIKQACPDTSVIILSMYGQEAYVLEALHKGAVGYLLKASSATHVLKAIHQAALGRYYLSPELRSAAVDSYLQGAETILSRGPDTRKALQ